MFDNIYNKHAGRKPLRGIGSVDATGTTETSIDYSPLVDCTTVLLSGATSLTSWKLPPDISTLYCSSWGNSTLPPLPATLLTLICDSGSLTSLPTLPASLNTLICNANPLSGIPNIPAGLGSLDCHDCNLTAPQVNALLAQLVASGLTSRLLDCSGSNAAPTGQGITDKATLTTRGWSITTS